MYLFIFIMPMSSAARRFNFISSGWDFEFHSFNILNCFQLSIVDYTFLHIFHMLQSLGMIFYMSFLAYLSAVHRLSRFVNKELLVYDYLVFCQFSSSDYLCSKFKGGARHFWHFLQGEGDAPTSSRNHTWKWLPLIFLFKLSIFLMLSFKVVHYGYDEIVGGQPWLGCSSLIFRLFFVHN